MKIFFTLLISLISCNQVFSQWTKEEILEDKKRPLKSSISCNYCEKLIKHKQIFYTIDGSGARRYGQTRTLARAHEYYAESLDYMYYNLEWRRSNNKYCSKKCATESDNN